MLNAWAMPPNRARSCDAVVDRDPDPDLRDDRAADAATDAGGVAGRGVDGSAGVWIASPARPAGAVSPSYVFVLCWPTYACAFVAIVPSACCSGSAAGCARRRSSAAISWSSCSASGGMGEVWRAEHRLLARDAAIKLVRPEVLGARSEAEGQTDAAAVRARGAGDGGAELAAHDSGVRLRRHPRRHVLLRDGAAGRTRPRVAGARVRAGAGRTARSTCCGRSATRWPMRTRAGSSIATSSRPTSTSAAWDSSTTSSKVLDFGLVKFKPGATGAGRRWSRWTTRRPARPRTWRPKPSSGDKDVDRRADVYALGCVAYYPADRPAGVRGRHVDEDAPAAPARRRCRRRSAPSCPSRASSTSW